MCTLLGKDVASNRDGTRGADESLRILALNMCLLPAGIKFSGNYLIDGDDRKSERLRMLLDLIGEYDVVLLNEIWGSKWSSYHSDFIEKARNKGFNVVSDPIGAVSNTGNMIMSRTPLQNATSMVFQNTAGWQSLVSNGVLYATTILPDGMTLHLFTTHLQCTTAPPAEASCSSPDSNTARVLNMVEGGTENVRMRQLYEMKSFMDRTICFEDDMWLLAGDLNIEGGSHEYYEMVQLFGREALGAPEFQSTYNTESFLTPPGWRGVEYDVCLDHVITNLKNVDDFSVLADNISDHRGLAVTIDCPRAERRRDFECVAPVEEHAKTPSDPAQEERVGEDKACSAVAARFKLSPSMVTWAPPHTLCRGGGGELLYCQ